MRCFYGFRGALYIACLVSEPIESRASSQVTGVSKEGLINSCLCQELCF
jgi:hypothetical protein